jgi:hypothetical protein
VGPQPLGLRGRFRWRDDLKKKGDDMNRSVLVFCVFALLVPEVAAAQEAQQAAQMKALEMIVNTANQICVSPPLDQHSEKIELSGQAKAAIAGMLSKITDLGIDGAVKYSSKDSRGVLQEKLADAIIAGNNCRKDVLDTLKALIPGLNKPNHSGSAASPECTLESVRNELLLPHIDRDAAITADARGMRQQYQFQRFDCVANIARALLEVDQDNGHGLYYFGEVWNVRSIQDPAREVYLRARMREAFRRYLSVERNLADSEKDGTAAACYLRSKGYCAERTAWINHLMAIDFLRMARNESDRDTKIKMLRDARDFVEADLSFGGFDQIVPSTVLKQKVEYELQNLGCTVESDVQGHAPKVHC